MWLTHLCHLVLHCELSCPQLRAPSTPPVTPRVSLTHLCHLALHCELSHVLSYAPPPPLLLHPECRSPACVILPSTVNCFMSFSATRPLHPSCAPSRQLRRSAMLPDAARPRGRVSGSGTASRPGGESTAMLYGRSAFAPAGRRRTPGGLRRASDLPMRRFQSVAPLRCSRASLQREQHRLQQEPICHKNSMKTASTAVFQKNVGLKLPQPFIIDYVVLY